jgi:hypothetical protein
MKAAAPGGKMIATSIKSTSLPLTIVDELLIVEVVKKWVDGGGARVRAVVAFLNAPDGDVVWQIAVCVTCHVRGLWTWKLP